MKTESYAKADPSMNRVYLSLTGSHDIEEAKRMKLEYEKAIELCNPGFTVLADVSDYIPGAPEVQEIHEEAIAMAEKAGISKVARVVGRTPLGGMQINRISSNHHQYLSTHFDSVEDAEDYLNA